MEMLNRSVAFVKPKRPYLEWCREDDDEGLADTVFEDMCAEAHVYLLPEYEDPSSRRRVLTAWWPAIFASMLEGWSRDDATWPQDRTRTMFDKWFDVQMCSVVEDLHIDEPLEHV